MDEKVEDYLYALLPPRDVVVRDMEEYAAKHKTPIIGPAVARMLALLV
jgi:predicted O-methyltransferase YrrM